MLSHTMHLRAHVDPAANMATATNSTVSNRVHGSSSSSSSSTIRGDRGGDNYRSNTTTTYGNNTCSNGGGGNDVNTRCTSYEPCSTARCDISHDRSSRKGSSSNSSNNTYRSSSSPGGRLGSRTGFHLRATATLFVSITLSS